MNQPDLTQDQTPLVARLNEYRDRSWAGFHTPGHGRGHGISPRLVALCGDQVFRADLPELPDLDNLFAPEGVIQQAQDLAALAIGAEQTWFLVNGSTAGIEAAILTTCKPGEKLILPRNVHRSAIAGVILSGAIPVFVQPDYDPVLDLAHSVSPQAVAIALAQHPDAKAVLMVSPTYYGTCGDVAAIAHLAHQHDIPLLVDEAHGAHFTFHPDLPTPALACGADLVVQSTHKTLTALTQAAMVHVQGHRLERNRLSQSLALVQSSSPNYLLLASLDAARHQMATQGKAIWEETLKLAQDMRSRLSQISGLAVLSSDHAITPGFVELDSTRITVTVTELGLDGFTADDLLCTQYGVLAELPTLQHLTFIISPGNTQADLNHLIKGFEALAQAPRPATRNPRHQNPQSIAILTCIPHTRHRSAESSRRSPTPHSPAQQDVLDANKSGYMPQPAISPHLPALSPREAFFAEAEIIPLAQAVNRVSAELVCPYPPGIPVLIPGEMVTEAAIAYLQEILASGGVITGCIDPTLHTLKVVREN